MSTKHEFCDSIDLAPVNPCGFSDCGECDSCLAGYGADDCTQKPEKAEDKR